GEVGTLATAAVIAPGWHDAVADSVEQGMAVVQDEGSQLCVELLGEVHGRVWDACAGQGGKTAQILDLWAEPRADDVLLATDLHANKLKRLGSLVQRAQTKAADRLQTQQDDVTTARERGHFDVVL